MSPWLKLLRPKQWLKNLFVFAPLLFAHRFGDPRACYMALMAALAFLSVSCVVYIINDMCDVAEDRRHPVKKLRPLAAGTLHPAQAAFMACVLAALALFILTILPLACAVIIGLYVGFNIIYTLKLKKIAIVDVFFIASCYVLRVLMGGYALGVYISPWMILTTFLLTLFVGFSKRYHELSVDNYGELKPNLQHYSRELLDRIVVICGASTLIMYAIYTAEMGQQTGHVGLVYTVVFVAFGLFRYLQSVYVFKEGGEPESIILRDKVQALNMALWLLVTLGILS